MAEGGGAVIRLRIEGAAPDVSAAARALRGVLEVVDESRDYPNRPPSREVRRYLTVRASKPCNEEVRR